MISLLYTHNVLTLTNINISKYGERDKDKKIITSYTYAPSYSNIVCTADEAINIINPIFKVSATKTATSKLGAFQPAMNYKKEEVTPQDNAVVNFQGVTIAHSHIYLLRCFILC